ncbi:NfeD family protein [Microbacter sp. GSS18]|nr:NfeD family protein [Microbacter sp. GSS18]
MLPDLTQWMWILWLALAFLFVIIELVTLEFTFLMLAVGSLVGGLGVNLLGGPWWLQVGMAAAISGLLLFTIRPLLLRALRRSSKPVATNVDAIFGMGARVIAPFSDGAGSVKLDNGETWTARLAHGTPDAALGVGDRAVVVAVHGATVEVSPAGARPAAYERTDDDG